MPLAVLFGVGAVASPAPGARYTPAAPSPCTNGEQSAIDETACELSAGLGHLDPSVVVAAGAPTGDRLVSRPSDFATRVAKSVAIAVNATAPALTGAQSPIEARMHATGTRMVLFVAMDVSGGRLRVTANGYTAESFWDRVRKALPTVVIRASSERRLDGEMGSYLQPVPFVSGHVEKVAAPSDVVALGCGDVDGDGSLEIVVVGRRRVETGRIRTGRFESTGKVEWAKLSPVAPSPLREPIASVVVTPGRYVDVGLTDRKTGVRLGPTLTEIRALDQPVPVSGLGCLARSGLGLGAPLPCVPDEKSASLVPKLSDVDAVSGTRVVAADGRSRAIVAFRERAAATVALADDAGHTARLPGVGAQIAVSDLDLDGSPELVFGADTLNAANDTLAIRSWTNGGELPERLRLPVPEGIKAIATCPPDDARAAAVIIATGSSSWVVR